MHSNWKFGKNDVSSYSHCDDIQNNCDKCGKLYRCNWRRRRTRDKICNFCVNEVKCNVVINYKKNRHCDVKMNFASKPSEETFCLEKRAWDSSMSLFQLSDSSPAEPHPVISESVKKFFGFQDFTDQLLSEMKMEFGEELRNSHKPLRIEFDWPSTNQLSKVDCLRAFNIMKQILLREMTKCDEFNISDPFVLRRKFYLERRLHSLEREKIRRLKVYESLYIQEEVKGGFEYLWKS